MSNLIDNAGLQVIQQTVDTVNQMAPFGQRQSLPNNPQRNPSLLRGYLMQPVSRGEQALVALVARRPEYITFKIDLAGVIYLNHPDGDSSFKLRFLIDGQTWFEAPSTTVFNRQYRRSIPIDELDLKLFGKIISSSSADVSNDGLTSAIPLSEMVLALGHPTLHTLLVDNSDLYPAIQVGVNPNDEGYVESLIGSWIFGIPRHVLPNLGIGFDVQLLFSNQPNQEPVELYGPAVMTINQIADTPTGNFVIATEIMDVSLPTPLRGGTPVTLGYFEDIGYGIIGANPREHLFRIDFNPEA